MRKNQKLVADFSTRHINTSYSNQLVMDDIDWVLKQYVRVSNDDFSYMQNSRSVMRENILLIVAVPMQYLLQFLCPVTDFKTLVYSF